MVPLMRSTVIAALAMLAPCVTGGVAQAADIPATEGSLSHHVWSTFTPKGALPNTNGTQVATGVFSYTSQGATLASPAGPAFTVNKVSGPTTTALRNIIRPVGTAGYAPGAVAVANTGFPGFPTPANGWPEQHEVGGTTTTTVMRYNFASALPAGSIAWSQDVEVNETTTFTFYDCSNTLINPSGFDAYLLSTNNLPTRTFNAANVVIQGGSVAENEPVVGIVLRSSNVCRIDVSFAMALNSYYNQVYFSVPRPRITLAKALGGIGRIAGTDQFTPQIRDGGNTVVNVTTNSTTTGAGATVTAGTGTTGGTAVARGSPYVLTEVGAGTTDLGLYAGSISCTNSLAGSGTVLPTGAGQSFSITPLDDNDNITCTLTNTPVVADLSLTKTNTPGQNNEADLPDDTLLSGVATVYTLVANNVGPVAADGAMVRDAPESGLTCTMAECTAVSGGASCPMETGTALLNGLTTAGVAIPLLPAGGSVTFEVTCTVD